MDIEQGFTAIAGYASYENYTDSKFFEVAPDRTAPDILCRTMCGEANSQYVSFQMPRFFDGVDLAGKQLFIRWYNGANMQSGGGYADICDARCNDDFIRFGWLLGSDVTAIPGTVAFVVMATGVGEGGKDYLFKTTLAKLYVSESMANGVPADRPDEDWFTRLMADVARMQAAAREAEAVVGQVSEAVSSAQTAAAEASRIVAEGQLAAQQANEAAQAAREAAELAAGDREFFLLLNPDGSVSLRHTSD